jgi:signal recognition particle subunit SRP54
MPRVESNSCQNPRRFPLPNIAIITAIAARDSQLRECLNSLLPQYIQQMQKMMRMMKGGNQKKLMRQMEAMKGKGGFPGM